MIANHDHLSLQEKNVFDSLMFDPYDFKNVSAFSGAQRGTKIYSLMQLYSKKIRLGLADNFFLTMWTWHQNKRKWEKDKEYALPVLIYQLGKYPDHTFATLLRRNVVTGTKQT